MTKPSKPKPPSRHTVEVPDSLWKWFQQLSGNTIPGNAIRDALHEYRLAHMIANPPTPAASAQYYYPNTASDELSTVYTGPMDGETVPEIPKPISYRLRALNLQADPFDHQFTAAMATFVAANNDDVDAALTYFENLVERGVHSPRAWLMEWYKSLPAEPVQEPPKVPAG